MSLRELMLRPETRACDTLLQVAQATRSQPLQTALSRSGGLEAARWRNPTIAATLGPTDRHMLIFHERGSTAVEGRIGSTVQGHGSRIGSVTAVPAGTASHWRLHGPCDVIHVYVETSRLCTADGRARPLEPMFAREDRWLQHWFGLLSSELDDAQRDGNPLAPLLADEFEGLLVAHLLSGTARPPRQRGGLPGGDVALRVGLVNAARLSRLFRQRRGVALGRWRRLHGD